MKLNVGTIDRVARAVIGLALIAATLMGWIGVWGWIGIVPLATAVVSFCPLYAALGISSRPARPNQT
jgi:Inner membrane protein YgaP-like, transmembrane domain